MKERNKTCVVAVVGPIGKGESRGRSTWEEGAGHGHLSRRTFLSGGARFASAQKIFLASYGPLTKKSEATFFFLIVFFFVVFFLSESSEFHHVSQAVLFSLTFFFL